MTGAFHSSDNYLRVIAPAARILDASQQIESQCHDPNNYCTRVFLDELTFPKAAVPATPNASKNAFLVPSLSEDECARVT
jgi:hypothetical protein